MDTSSKQQILARIKDAGLVSLAPMDRSPGKPSQEPRSAWVDRFAEYAAEYRAHVVRIDRPQIPATIRQLLVDRGSDRVVIPADLDSDWIPTGGARDDGFDHAALAGFDAVITGSSVAIAETGTIVLDAGPGQGRRALTLIPDHHICVVFEEQVVAGVADAVAFLTDAVRLGRPLTWISGPSATSDIELCRVEGVHGPRKLDVILAA